MNDSERIILEDVIIYHGDDVQKKKAIEEMAELIVEIAKERSVYKIAEEIADVRIMLDQLEMIYELGNKVQEFRDMKLARIKSRIQLEVTPDLPF